MDFTALITPKAISARWTSAASNRIPYIGESLFPVKKQAGLDLSFIKGSHGVPISLMPSAFDAKLTFRDRIGVTELRTEMPFFREGFKIKEKDRQEILKFENSNNPYVRTILDNIFNDADELIEGAYVAGERERMMLLFPEDGNVGISIVANGVSYIYNYDPDGSWKANNYFELTGTAKWSDASHANPMKDIDTVRKAIRSNTGSEIKYAIMNSNTFNYLNDNQKIMNRFITKIGVSVAYATEDEIKGVVEDTAKVKIIIYDKQFRDENKVVHGFVPDGYVALIPEGALGNTVFGTTPEEADLIANPKAEVELINQGIAITKEVQTQPVNVNTWVSQIVLPSYERMDEVALLKVL